MTSHPCLLERVRADQNVALVLYTRIIYSNIFKQKNAQMQQSRSNGILITVHPCGMGASGQIKRWHYSCTSIQKRKSAQKYCSSLSFGTDASGQSKGGTKVSCKHRHPLKEFSIAPQAALIGVPLKRGLALATGLILRP